MSTAPGRTLQVGLLMFPEVEVLDFAGPYEVFTTAARMALRAAPEAPPPFAVSTIARRAGPCRARAGLQAQVDHDFAQHPPLDVLIVPGGVVTAELQQPETLAWLARTAPGCSLVASVCTGAFLLAAAGLLPAGSRVITHWEDIDDLRQAHPALNVQDAALGLRWVDLGRIVTSAGISAGIDMSLHLVERLAGRALAERTARQMDFAWTENLPPPPH
ncbi:DJ-1/PfpI family protein [Aquabacterium sp.]|uniref:DJ-1/PfpI family protein n=1 Tax=Aquabacterium sp. TaxID=1872578 RepID=UPI0037833B44